MKDNSVDAMLRGVLETRARQHHEQQQKACTPYYQFGEMLLPTFLRAAIQSREASNEDQFGFAYVSSLATVGRRFWMGSIYH